MNSARTGSTARRRILIVGDLALGRSTMRMVLSRLGYQVTCVASGHDAGTALGHTGYGLLLVAVDLPDMKSLDFVRWLRQRPGQPPNLPVLLFGDVWDQAGSLRACREVGVDGYLPKPISFGRLVATVNELTRPSLPQEAALPSDRPAPVDIAHFTSFTDGDRQLEREIVSLYFATAEHYLAAMREAQASGAPWDRPAHSLKGASANLGARQVADLAREAEHAPPAPEAMARIEAALAGVRTFFDERWRGEEPARTG